MGVLPDHEIARLSPPLIEPFKDGNLQPASYDVELASKLLIPKTIHSSELDLRHGDKPLVHELEMSLESGYILRHNKMILGSTIEYVDIPETMVGRVEGKSTLARLGIQIHSAGYLDPGFRGNVTLEIVNFWPRSIVMWTGMKIAQLSFEYLTSGCQTPYNAQRNHYQDSEGVIGPRYGDPLS